MDLQAYTSAACASVTPPDTATVKISTGHSLPDAAGLMKPQYQTITNVRADVQAMSSTDLDMVDGLNLTGIKRSIYLHGQFAGIQRPNEKGGDLIIIASGAHKGVWLTVMVLENWGDWCRIAVVLQNQAPS